MGMAKRLNALRKAIVNLRSTYFANLEDGRGLDPALVAALGRGIREGVVDESQASELAGIAQGEYLSTLLPGNKAHRLTLQFNRYGSFMFQSAEKINRRTVFRAAWELARDPRNVDKDYIKELERLNPQSYQQMLSEGLSPTDARAYLAAKDAVRGDPVSLC